MAVIEVIVAVVVIELVFSCRVYSINNCRDRSISSSRTAFAIAVIIAVVVVTVV